MEDSCSLAQKQFTEEVPDSYDVVCDSCKSSLLISDK